MNSSFKIRPSRISVVISISLLLFMLGVLSILLLNSKKLSNHVKENFTLTVILKNDAKEISIRQFQKTINNHEYVKNSEIITKEEAAEILARELDEDFIAFLGYNPLSNYIDIQFKAIYATAKYVEEFQEKMLKNEVISEILFDKDLMMLVNSNLKKISAVFFIISLLFTLIAFALINNSIRLSIYSQRFTIKTMQLVGATKGFIQKPFILKSLLLGLLGGIVGSFLIFGFVYYLNNIGLEILGVFSPLGLSILFISVCISGMVVAIISTFFAVKKYLKLTSDQLYL